MKLLVFSEYYHPERFLINEICQELVSRGNEVTVVTGRPNYNLPGGRVPKEYRSGEHDDEMINGVRVLRCRVCGRGKSTVRLVLNYLSYAFNADRLARRLEGDFDAVYVYQVTPVLQLIPAARYCRRNSKKLICYCLDPAPKCGESNLKHFRLAGRLYATLSKRLYSACDLIPVTSKAFTEYMTDVNGIPEEKLCYLPQHASDSLLKESLIKPCCETAQFYFAGNIGKGASLETAVRAAHSLVSSGEKRFRVHLVGDGSAKPQLETLVKKLELSDFVLFDGAVPMKDMPQIYKKADALLLTLRKDQFTVPGKLQAYMATGKPVFGAVSGSGKELIEETGCGLCVEAEDRPGLAELMRGFISNPGAYAAMGMKGKEYFAENFTLKAYTERLLRYLENVG